MNERIVNALSRLFEKHRIVFWYDDKCELKDDFDALELPGVEKCVIDNNELGLKYRLLREQPRQQFLLYKAGAKPGYLDNWLLDVQLAAGEFCTDQTAIWLSELELPHEFAAVIDNHVAFFDSKKRIEELKKHLKPGDTKTLVQLKMVAVCVGADTRLDSILEHLLDELSAGLDAMKLVQRCCLETFLWDSVKRQYGYEASQPSLMDFVISLFKYAYFQTVGPTSKAPLLNADALVFLKRWKDSRPHQKAFEHFSAECADILQIESDLHGKDIKELLDADYFELIDKKIISDMVLGIQARTQSSGDITLWCRQRRQSHWYERFEYHYIALDVAAQFFALLDVVNFHAAHAGDMVNNYARNWFKLDQCYRQYIHALKVSGSTTLLNGLTEQIENFYTNRYLLPLNNEWQRHVDAMDRWSVPGIPDHASFFTKWVKPHLDNNKKIYVIISDALRYEIADELVTRIRQEDRFQADLDCLLSVLPSFTQLGMAALLPQQEGKLSLRISADKAANAFIGDQLTQGTANRDKILKAALGDRALAMKSNDLMEMNASDSRDLLKDHDVIYFYHNRIDHTGDKMQSEGEACQAAEAAFEDLLRIIKKLTNANASNILITADHGFIYQNRAIEESDFLSAETSGKEYLNRRFILGQTLGVGKEFRHFTPDQLGLAGEVEVAIPKGIQRLRLSGSGSRFVHGGASLQEVIVPVIKINKSRQSDTSQVEVEILRTGSTVITSGQIAVTLYQAEPVSEKTQGRKLRASIFNQAGKLISDQHECVMDFTSENPREREYRLRLILTKEADSENGKTVLLKLDEQVDTTSHYRTYKVLEYTVRKSFTSDFDF